MRVSPKRNVHSNVEGTFRLDETLISQTRAGRTTTSDPFQCGRGVSLRRNAIFENARRAREGGMLVKTIEVNQDAPSHQAILVTFFFFEFCGGGGGIDLPTESAGMPSPGVNFVFFCEF